MWAISIILSSASRRTEALDFEDDRAVPVRLDLLDHDSVVAAAAGTDIASGYDGPKIDPRDLPRLPLDGLAGGSIEVIVDDWTAMVKVSLAGDSAAFYTKMAELLGST